VKRKKERFDRTSVNKIVKDLPQWWGRLDW